MRDKLNDNSSFYNFLVICKINLVMLIHYIWLINNEEFEIIFIDI